MGNISEPKITRLSYRNENPDQVFIPYCTGDTHGGTRTKATDDTWGLHFGGHINMMAIIDQLNNDNGLNEADLVVFAGGSAGGMGVFFNGE